MQEREPQHELPQRGELLCLYHPAGYIVGLLMVDRPFPAPEAWLQTVQETYGECELLPMTASGERGLLCQMQVEEGSLSHLYSFPGFPDQIQSFQEALAPLLEKLPAPMLAVRWDEERRVWLSQMVFMNRLPPAVHEVFAETGYGCLAVESSMGVVHVCHAADVDIEHFADYPIKPRWSLERMPTAPLVRLELTIQDDPDLPYVFESFLNVGNPDQLAVLAQLAGQEELYLTFYGDDLTYRYTIALAQDEQQWQALDELTAKALTYWESLPPEARDYDQAKADFML
jgi:hypothetical protein